MKTYAVSAYLSGLALQLKKTYFWYVRPTKTQISLRIRAVWSVFVVRIKKLCLLGYLKLIVVGFNDTSTLVGHFVCLPEKGRREIEEVV